MPKSKVTRIRIPIFTAGRSLAIVVNKETASVIGRYLSIVGRFLSTNDPKVLAEFVGTYVEDVKGRRYPLETRPNFLYGLTPTEPDVVEVYRIFR